jgi:hypothetical protein
VIACWSQNSILTPQPRQSPPRPFKSESALAGFAFRIKFLLFKLVQLRDHRGVDHHLRQFDRTRGHRHSLNLHLHLPRDCHRLPRELGSLRTDFKGAAEEKHATACLPPLQQLSS